MTRWVWSAALVAALGWASGCVVESRADYADFYEGCDVTSDCIGGADACFLVDWIEGRGRMCSIYCETHDDCPGWSSCWELVGDPEMQSVCYARCDADRDCARGFRCVDAEMGDRLVDSICLPR